MSAEHHGGVPRHPNDVTPRWLTARLREVGALPSGSVTSVAVELAEKWNVAQPARLAIDYDRDAPRDAPRRLFVKIAETDDPLSDIFLGETAFYAARPPGRLPVPACFGAFSDRHSRASCLLLEDLSDTHGQTPWPLPPSLPQCESAVRALARLHAHWWRAVDSGSGPTRAVLAANENRLAGHFQALLPGFLAYLDDRLAPERRFSFAAKTARVGPLPESTARHQWA